MTKEELQRLYEDLEQEEKLLRIQLGEIADKEPGGYQVRIPNYGKEEDDDAREVADLDRDLALKRELETKLNDILKTKEKIKSGTYGKCEKCSVNISPQRLKVMPIAVFCIDCAKTAR